MEIVSELLLGAGADRTKRLFIKGREEWTGLVTLDISRAHTPDIVWDLEEFPYPFIDNQFDEIHAYEVLEHTGTQGDYRFFFDQFNEIWRILKPEGHFFATVPKHDSDWVWGDPGHKRYFPAEWLVFLLQEAYETQVGKTAMTDYRWCYHGDFNVIHMDDYGESMAFILKAIK